MGTDYSDIYYIGDILIVAEISVWMDQRRCIYAKYGGAEVRAYSTNTIKGLPKDVPELWCNTPLGGQKSVQHILNNVDLAEQLKKCSKDYVSQISFSIENYDMVPRYSFHGFYSANQADGHLYSMTFERIIYETEDEYERDSDKCKSIHVHYDINNIETIEGDKDLLDPEFGFGDYKKQFFDHCDLEFAKCKGPFHIRMKEVIR